MLFICHPVKKIKLSIACWVASETHVHSSTFRPCREVAVKKDFHSHETFFVYCEFLCRNVGTSPTKLVSALYYSSASGPCMVYHLFFINWSADAEQIPGVNYKTLYFCISERTSSKLFVFLRLFQGQCC